MGWLILPFVLKHKHQISMNNIYDIGIKQHMPNLQTTARWSQDPNYMFLTIYSECPRDVQINKLSLYYGNRVRGTLS